jgi:hypothetical protein
MPSRLSCRLGWHRWQPLKAPGQDGWYKKCRVCGTRDTDETLPLLPIVLSVGACVAGVVVELTLQSLLGPLLIIGGVFGLGVTMLPAAFERIGVFLSTGSLRQKSRR